MCDHCGPGCHCPKFAVWQRGTRKWPTVKGLGGDHVVRVTRMKIRKGLASAIHCHLTGFLHLHYHVKTLDLKSSGAKNRKTLKKKIKYWEFRNYSLGTCWLCLLRCPDQISITPEKTGKPHRVQEPGSGNSSFLVSSIKMQQCLA